MVASSTFMGLDATAWSAVGTILLVLVTAIYVFLTGRLAKRAAESAGSAAESAKSAEEVAQATFRMAATAEAALRVDFAVSYELDMDFFPSMNPAHYDPDMDSGYLKVECLGATVYLHAVEVTFAVFDMPGSKGPPEKPTGFYMGEDFAKYGSEFIPGARMISGLHRKPLKPSTPREQPFRIHLGESARFHWPWGPVDTRRDGLVYVDLVYSIQREGAQQRLARSIPFSPSSPSDVSPPPPPAS